MKQESDTTNRAMLGGFRVPPEVWYATPDASVLVTLDRQGRTTVQWLEAAQEVADLIGWTAPPEIEAVFLSSLAPVDLHGRERHGVVVTGVEETGPSGSWWFPDQATNPLCGPAVGVGGDLLARGFALPTAIPTASPGWFWGSLWVADALRAGARNPLEVAAWYPTVDPRDLAGGNPESLSAMLSARHCDHTAATGWHGVQASLAAGAIGVGRLSAEVVEWFDAGSLSRTLVHLMPTAGDLCSASDWAWSLVDWVAGVLGSDLWPQ